MENRKRLLSLAYTGQADECHLEQIRLVPLIHVSGIVGHELVCNK